jgi:Protein of unknown function (DUF559)
VQSLKTTRAAAAPGSSRSPRSRRSAPAPTLEVDFLAFCRRHDLPRPAVGATIAGYEVDFSWPHARLIVETDGRAAHRTRRAFESDRTRDRRTLRAGYRTIRLTDRALREEASEVAGDLRNLLAHAGTSSARSAASRPRSSR